MIPLAFVIAVAIATLAVLVVSAISLMRHARRMAETVGRFRAEVEPVLRDIRRDTERATERLERFQADRGSQESSPPGERVISVDPDGPGGA